MFNSLKKIPAYIYDLIISNFLTVTSHIIMINYLIFKPTDQNLLDVGCGTGKPLKSILKNIPQSINIVGVDIDKSYVAACKQLFKNQSRINIYQKNFYQIKDISKSYYDIIFFSFSFMLMPNKKQALQVAKKNLNKNGRIAFLLTLNKNKNSIFEKLKPLIKLITTIDFGQVVYRDEFEQILESQKLKIVINERLYTKYNPLFWIFNIHYVQATI